MALAVVRPVYATIAEFPQVPVGLSAVMQVFVSEQSGTDPTEKVNRGERLVHGVNGRHRADEHHRLPFKPEEERNVGPSVAVLAAFNAPCQIARIH